jgi:hypothetical protein
MVRVPFEPRSFQAIAKSKKKKQIYFVDNTVDGIAKMIAEKFEDPTNIA